MTLVPMATKFGTKSAVTWLVYEISKDIFSYSRGLSGPGYWMMPEIFYYDEPLLPLQRKLIWDKIGYYLACVRDIPEILAYNRGFSWSVYRMVSVKFYSDRPWLPWQRNLRQNRSITPIV